MTKAKKRTAGKKAAAKIGINKKAAPKKAAKKPAKRTRTVTVARSRKQAGVPNIDYSLCQGCGGCAEVFPRLFEMRGERAWVIAPEAFDPVRDAGVMTICPYYAISIEKV